MFFGAQPDSATHNPAAAKTALVPLTMTFIGPPVNALSKTVRLFEPFRNYSENVHYLHALFKII
jgi:hypothetical protein